MSIVQMAQSLHWQGWRWHGLRRHRRSDGGWIALLKEWWRRMQDRRANWWPLRPPARARLI